MKVAKSWRGSNSGDETRCEKFSMSASCFVHHTTDGVEQKTEGLDGQTITVAIYIWSSIWIGALGRAPRKIRAVFLR